MKVRVTEAFGGLSVGYEATVIRHGTACGLSGVKDGQEVYLVKASMALDDKEKAIMEVIATQFPEAREHMDEGVRIDCIPASHIEIIDGGGDR